MPRLEPPPGFLTSKQAQERLKVSDTLLRKYVTEKRLKKYGPPASKQKPFYDEAEVEALRLTLRVFPEAHSNWRDNPSFRFEVATQDDIRDIRALNYETYKERYPIDFPVSTKTCIAWMKKNPQTFFIARDSDGNVRGSIILLPVSKNIVQQFIHDEIDPDDITDEMIEEYRPGKPLDLYVLSMITDPSFSNRTKRACGSCLLKGITEFFIHLGREGIDIREITARSFLPDGIRLLRHFGFAHVHSPVPGKELFVSNVEESGIDFLETYKKELAHWRSEYMQSLVER